MIKTENKVEIKIPIISEFKDPISVNGETISEKAIAAEMQYHPAASQQAAYRQAAQALIVRSLLLQQAKKLGIAQSEKSSDADTAVDPEIEQLLELEVQTPKADDANCQHYYANNLEKFKTAALVVASHILLPAAPDDLKTRRQMRELADDILEKLAQGATFESMAETYSVCPSKKDGGQLGQLSPGQTVAEFERQVFSLQELGVTKLPIETRYGFHIVRIDQHVEGKMMSYEQCKERISSYLQERVKRKAISQYIEFLASEANIKGFDLNVADSPLLQ